MSPMGGGLMQLLAYGAQDCYLSVSVPVDDCFLYTYRNTKRNYNNFDIVKREVYLNKNNFFTNKKYKEYCTQFTSTYYLYIKIKIKDNAFSYSITRDNNELQLVLKNQKTTFLDLLNI
jgi:hypothetical protein